MLGPDNRAVVVRKPDGTLEIKNVPRKAVKDRCPILGWLFIRGVVNFGSSLIRGVQDLFWSADFAVDEEEEAEQKEKKKQKKKKKKEAPEEEKPAEETQEEKTPADEKPAEEPPKKDAGEKKDKSKEEGGAGEAVMVGFTALISLVFCVALFFLLPTVLAGFFDRWIHFAVIHNLIEGVIRIVIFILYLYLTSKMKDMRRVYSYHGAEHKTIFCYEAGLPLTVENVRKQPRHHPRCGTSFLFVVIVIAIVASSIVFTFVNWSNVWVRLGTHLLLLLPVVAVSYELNRLVGRYDNPLTRILLKPGLWMQNFTTFEPDDSMIEVGITALSLVIPKEKGKDAW